jgi:hypothetical protein
MDRTDIVAKLSALNAQEVLPARKGMRSEENRRSISIRFRSHAHSFALICFYRRPSVVNKEKRLILTQIPSVSGQVTDGWDNYPILKKHVSCKTRIVVVTLAP